MGRSAIIIFLSPRRRLHYLECNFYARKILTRRSRTANVQHVYSDVGKNFTMSEDNMRKDECSVKRTTFKRGKRMEQQKPVKVL